MIVPVPVPAALRLIGEADKLVMVGVTGSVPEALLVTCGATEVGTTAFEGLEGPELPTKFVAVTVKVYEMPGVRPLIVVVVVARDTVLSTVPGDALTLNDVTTVTADSDQLTVAAETPGAAITSVGAVGGGVTNVNVAVEIARPPSVVTKTRTDPAACGAVTAVILVGDVSLQLDASTVPNCTRARFVNPDPLIVTVVPPGTGPEVGANPVILGGVGGVILGPTRAESSGPIVLDPEIVKSVKFVVGAV